MLQTCPLPLCKCINMQNFSFPNFILFKFSLDLVSSFTHHIVGSFARMTVGQSFGNYFIQHHFHIVSANWVLNTVRHYIPYDIYYKTHLTSGSQLSFNAKLAEVWRTAMRNNETKVKAASIKLYNRISAHSQHNNLCESCHSN